MAKKKHQGKKHKFKYAEPTAPAAGVSATAAAPASAPVAPARAQTTAARFSASTRDFSYVLGDLRRVGVLAVVLVAVELVLWFVMSHRAS